ncbi:MAG TPA: hypothetical protein VM261_04725 [Kofleriaceae bacterium]|nr:hypothetical protein [Kofleriaceae bacterium]
MLALVGTAGLAAGCVANNSDSGMRIVGNVAVGDTCVVDGAATTFLDNGLIDTASIVGYIFTPAVVNDLVTVGDEPTGPKTIYVTHARVDIDFYDSNFADLSVDPGLLRFRVPTSGSVEPNGGRSGFSFEVVPPELLAAIGDQLPVPTQEAPLSRTTLDVSVTMVGTHGSGEVVSNTFRYPVEVCKGCVAIDVGPCTGVPAGFEPALGGACGVLQDGTLECCDDYTVCPAVAAEGCGDGELQANEGCDDSGIAAGDGCSATCLIESGRACNIMTPGLTGNASCASGVCTAGGNCT